MPDLVMMEKLDVPIDSFECQREDDARFDEIVETLDRKVELD